MSVSHKSTSCKAVHDLKLYVGIKTIIFECQETTINWNYQQQKNIFGITSPCWLHWLYTFQDDKLKKRQNLSIQKEIITSMYSASRTIIKRLYWTNLEPSGSLSFVSSLMALMMALVFWKALNHEFLWTPSIQILLEH